MSYITNQAINSRSMNGILTITDGTAILEDGKLDCENVNVKTATITSLSNSNLVNCTTSTIASVDNDLVNKKYVVDNFVDRTNNLAQSINGVKTFSENVICSVATPIAVNHLTRKDYVDSNFVDRTNNLTQSINGQKTFSENVICSVATPTAVNHLTRKDYVDGNFVDRTNNLTQSINGQKTFSENVICSVATPTAVNHLTRKDYVDSNFVDRTNNLTQSINGVKTFSENVICSVATPTAVNHLTRKDYVDSNFVDRANNINQNIYGEKTFKNQMYTEGIVMRDGLIWQDVLAPKTNWVQSYIAGSTINFNMLYNLGVYAFNTRDSLSNPTTSFEITNPQTIIRNILYLNAGSRYYSGTNYTEFLQTGTQLTIKPVSNSGSLALFSTNSTGVQTQQLLINNSGVTTSTLNSTDINSSNYNTTTANGTTNFAFNTTTGIISIGPNITTGSIDLATSTANVNCYGTMVFYANPTTKFSTINQNSTILNIENPTPSGTIKLRTRPSVGVVQDSFTSSVVGNTSQVDLTCSALLNVTGQATFNGGAVFNNVIPTTAISATNANELVNFSTLNSQGFITSTSILGNNNAWTGTNTFSGDVTLSKTKNNSTYATYNALGSTYIGYMAEVPTGTYVGIASNTQYQLGAITLDSSNVGFWTCNYEVEINSITAGSISKIYVFISDNNVSTTIPITLAGAKANNFSTQTYTAGDSTYHSGSFSFLQSTTSVIYAVQLKVIVSSGTYQRKGQIRMLRIL